MDQLLDVMRRLRGPGGCPWDRQQSHESLRPYLLEEACEAMDAIASGDPQALVEELGDVLLQVAFHTVIAEEAQRFDYRAVEQTIVDKLIRRHPHVFGTVAVTGADEVLRNWQAIKGAEGKPEATVPHSLPALMRAFEAGRKADWPPGSPEAVCAALADRDGDAGRHLGRLLLAVVDYARSLGVNPELALREAVEARLSDGRT
jgi:XTP/dITP diphosphohydrolase